MNLEKIIELCRQLNRNSHDPYDKCHYFRKIINLHLTNQKIDIEYK